MSAQIVGYNFQLNHLKVLKNKNNEQSRNLSKLTCLLEYIILCDNRKFNYRNSSKLFSKRTKHEKYRTVAANMFISCLGVYHASFAKIAILIDRAGCRFSDDQRQFRWTFRCLLWKEKEKLQRACVNTLYIAMSAFTLLRYTRQDFESRETVMYRGRAVWCEECLNCAASREIEIEGLDEPLGVL